MKRAIGTLLALALFTGAGFAQARGGHGGGGHGGGARSGGAVAARPAMSGGFSHFTTGPMRFTTGQPNQFTTGAHWRPPVVGHPIVRPIPLPPRPVQPIHNHPGFVGGGGTVIITAPFYPVYPYPYPYPYATPVYGGSAYAEVPTYSDAPAYSDSQGDDPQGYSERNDYWYYCPDSQTYYPYVQTCPSPWVKVLPEPSSDAPAN
jgi:hypothetical protein